MFIDDATCREPAPYTELTAEIFSAATHEWRLAAPMSIGREYHTATRLLDGRVLVAGSIGQWCGPNETPLHWLNTAEMYDPVTDQWTPAATMHEERAWAAATLLQDGRVLVCGGPDATAEIYDPTTDTWSYTASMNHALSHHQALTLPDGRVIVTGWGDTEFYDPSSAQWTEGPPEPPRWNHYMFLLPSGRVFQTGGPEQEAYPDGSTRPVITGDILDLATGIWTTTAAVSRPRYEPGAVQLADGRVLVAGGSPDEQYYSSAQVDLFDERTGVWTEAADMLNQRMYPLLAPIAGGAVAIYGVESCFQGSAAVSTDPSSEIYDAVNN
jgi:hypothetical protein